MQRFLPTGATTVLLFLVLTAQAGAAEVHAKVRSALGEALRQKKESAEWSAVRIGNKIFEKDRLKTGKESEIVMALPDGSIVVVEEESEVSLAELNTKESAPQTQVEILSGNISFSAQKQVHQKSSFSFKTKHAVAAIRGTSGVVAIFRNQSIFSLASGKLQINSDLFLNGGETLLLDSAEHRVLQLASSGNIEFIKSIEEIIKDSTISYPEKLEQILNADSIYQENLQRLQSQVSCTLDILPDTVFNPTIELKGKCSAQNGTLHGAPLAFSQDGMFNQTVELDSTGFGPKIFHLHCNVNEYQVPCGEFKTYFTMRKITTELDSSAGFQLKTLSPVIASKDGILLEGTYKTRDSLAILRMNINGQISSGNLISEADGKEHAFSYQVPVANKQEFCNFSKLSVNFASMERIQREELDIDVQKVCAQKKRSASTVRFNSYDSLRCNADFFVSKAQNDSASLEVLLDGASYFKESISKSAKIRVPLKSGIHEYSVEIQNSTGNKTRTTKRLGCFPAQKFSIFLFGNKTEKLRIPPPPYGSTDEISKTLHFKIRLIENDPEYLTLVSVTQNGRTILRETNSQIQSLDYQIPVTLQRNGKNVFEIKVLHKNGSSETASKIYEVR